MEYLSDQPKKEYAFLQRRCLDPILDKHLPARPSAAFKKSMKAAEAEQQIIDNVLEVAILVLLYIYKYLYCPLCFLFCFLMLMF